MCCVLDASQHLLGVVERLDGVEDDPDWEDLAGR